ncbi:BREX-1 system adenine-specific DNA-methyltransferase PglX [Collinsella sp. HCP3S3_B8]|uniref:BREX-1 system adenine-specific DNA-methyltransferase PglX n=1 Tax=Collinsella sp. HCP3S3_B8 TaxID=3438933 RepID=UPI003F88E17D
MNDTAIKNYCIWARNELIAGVEARMRLYGVAEGAEPAGAAAVGGRALSPEETGWRDALLRAGAEEGFEHLRDRAAYTWFNRIAAVRYMEVHDFLPSRVRMFTRPAADGSWELGSQAADEALDVEIEGADPVRIAELKQAGEDGPLFRYLFLAQCAELSGCLPGVFQPVDACMALLLPANLMDADGVIGRMVGDIDEEDWEDVQVLGWMYQYYNSEVKDAFFASKAKETPDTIGPATQLFTPDWIVRYMVQNSLGRLWMLNNPASPLRAEMEYYIEPDSEHEDFIKIGGPEDISLCDPACGSGHILVYAFELLAKMYLERGYREREIPGLVLSRNLHGMEIDPRAAQIARLALAMCARGMDRRFFGRGVQADIAVLAPVALGEGDVPQGSALEKKKDLLDALAHLDEVGSLLAPGEGDLAAIRETIELTGADGLFGSSSRERLQRALATCETLARRHDCVVANPPYMGSSSFGPFMSKWVKKNYPDVKSDLCTCFIERGFNLAKDRGYAAMITMQSWMFLGSFEKMRSSLIEGKSILSMLHLGPRAFDAIGGEVVNVTADVVYNGRAACEGAYVRLVDINGSEAKRQKALEAIQNPDCGWFYRRDAETFKQIPGTPIAYWASEVTYEAFSANEKIREHAWGCNGMTTGENDRFLRLWFEVGSRSSEYCSSSAAEAKRSGATWFPYNKGGDFRKWYGNEEWVIDWKDDGKRARDYGHLVPRSQKYMFLPEITWSKISSGKAAFRYKDKGHLFDVAGLCLFPNEGKADLSLLAFCNSSVAQSFLSFLCPTLNFEVGGVCSMPFVDLNSARGEVDRLASDCISDSLTDYNSFEISCDFKRHPLV